MGMQQVMITHKVLPQQSCDDVTSPLPVSAGMKGSLRDDLNPNFVIPPNNVRQETGKRLMMSLNRNPQLGKEFAGTSDPMNTETRLVP